MDEEAAHEGAVKTFIDLGIDDELVKACEMLGWKNPTHVQIEAIPHALEGKDLIALAQTGSGKTGAFALPILQALLGSPQKKSFACIISPTRELAFQIAQQFEALGSCIGVRCAVLVGGVDKVAQVASIVKSHIIVGTPGRIVDHLSNTRGFSLSMLKYLVLDEADRLLNEEFEKSIDKILDAIPRKRRTYLFSATMTKKVKKLQRACLTNPVKIELASKYSTVDTLKQQYCLVPGQYKECFLVYILMKMSKYSTLVFTETCSSTRIWALLLRNLGIRALPICGQMSQSMRLGDLKCNILICTDVLSRGLDIPSVDVVINYDIPRDPENYIHRVGRTARAGRSGLAISLVDQNDLRHYTIIEDLIGRKFPKFPTEDEEVLLFNGRVEEAKRMAIMRIEETGGRSKRRRRGDEKEDEEEEVNRYLRFMNGKKFKKWKKSW